MKIIFFTQEDPFYVKIFFDEFLRRHKFLDDIKAIVISKPMGKKSILKLAQQMYCFYGLFDFIRMGCKYAYIRLMGKKPIGRIRSGDPPTTYTIKQLAKAYGLNIIERSDLNSQGFLSLIKQYDPDLFISVASPIIFKAPLINIPKLDCINIHSAPLPQYRGMLPNFWQMYRGEKQAGITIHRIDVGIDTGDIIVQGYVTIDPHESLHQLIRKSKKHGAKLMTEVIEGFRQGTIEYKKMIGAGSYFSFPNRKDVIEFRKRGRSLLYNSSILQSLNS